MIRPHRLPCGCDTSGRLCDDHRRDEAVASGPVTLVAVALFVGMVAAWTAILG